MRGGIIRYFPHAHAPRQATDSNTIERFLRVQKIKFTGLAQTLGQL